MWILCCQRTEAGMRQAQTESRCRQLREFVERQERRKQYDGEFCYIDYGDIWNAVKETTSHRFLAPIPIRAWFRENRENFYNGKSSDWDSWLNGEDSSEETLSENGLFRFFFIEESALEEGVL